MLGLGRGVQQQSSPSHALRAEPARCDASGLHRSLHFPLLRFAGISTLGQCHINLANTKSNIGCSEQFQTCIGAVIQTLTRCLHCHY